MASPEQFQGMIASVFPSQETEVVIAKQPALSEYAREVRSVINQLPPDVTRSLLAEYREPSPQLLNLLEKSIMARELAIESTEQEVNLDRQWLDNVGTRHVSLDETGLNEDDWNSRP